MASKILLKMHIKVRNCFVSAHFHTVETADTSQLVKPGNRSTSHADLIAASLHYIFLDQY